MSKLTRQFLLGNVGIESADEDTPEQQETVIVSDPVAESVAEVIEAADDIEEAEGVKDEMQEAADSLESIAAQISSTLADGGMSPQTAAMSALACRIAAGPYSSGSPVSSVESFGGTHGQLQSTTDSLEGIKEEVAKIWQKIQQVIANIIARVKDFYLKTFDGAARLKKRAMEVSAKAEGITTDAKEAEVNISSSMVSALSMGGKLGDVNAGVTGLASVSKDVLGRVNDDMVKLADDFAKAVSGLKVKSDDEFTASLSGITGLSLEVGTSVLKNDVTSDKRFANLDKGAKVLSSDEMLGGQALFCQTYQSGENTDAKTVLANLRKMSFTVQDFAATAGEVKDESVKTLDGKTIKSISDNVGELAASIEDFKRKSDAASKAKDGVSKAGKSLADSLKSSELDNANGATASAVLNTAGTLTALIDQPATKFMAYAVKTASQALGFAERSLSQY